MFAIIVGILALCLFNYMDTRVPEGVTEVWSARILDTSLRTMGKVVNIYTIHDHQTPSSTVLHLYVLMRP